MKNKIFSRDAFKNKNVIISGGAGDIGMEIAIAFAAAGANKIALLDKNIKQLTTNAEYLKKFDCEIIKINVDLSDDKAIENSVKKLYEKNNHWDILVTTAGLFIGGTLIDYKIEDWNALMNINAQAVFVLSRLVAKKMIAAGHGKIIHIGSSSTYYGTPGSGAYAASKVIINQLTQTMAVEWGEHNIQVNAICPTVTETKFLNLIAGDALHEKFRNKLKEKMPLKRLLKPSDIAPTVLFLASDSAQFINGAIIPIDGGSRLVST